MKSQIEEQPYPLQTKVSFKDQEKDYFPQEACPDRTLSPVSTERPGSLLSSAVGTVPKGTRKKSCPHVYTALGAYDHHQPAPVRSNS